MIRPILFEMSPKYVNEIYCFAFVFAIGKMFLIIIFYSLFSIILSIKFCLNPFACATCLIIFLFQNFLETSELLVVCVPLNCMQLVCMYSDDWNCVRYCCVCRCVLVFDK